MSSIECLSVSNVAVLEICAQVEDMNATLYYLFADQSGDTPEVQKMWRKTAMEEEKHASMIRLGARLRGCAITDFKSSEEKATKMLAIVTSLVGKAKAKPPSYADSLRVAIQMEEKLVEFHMDFIACFVDEECNKLFKSMINADKEHVKRLKLAYEKVTSGA